MSLMDDIFEPTEQVDGVLLDVLAGDGEASGQAASESE